MNILLRLTGYEQLEPLHRAEGVDLQYRALLFKMAEGFVRLRGTSNWWQIGRRKMCEDAIFNIYMALR